MNSTIRSTWILGLLLYFASAWGRSPVDILEPALLTQLDQPGVYSLASILGNDDLESLNSKNTNFAPLNIVRLNQLTLQNSPRFELMRRTIEADVSEIKRLANEPIAYSSEHAEKLGGGGNVARHFDPYWLTSAKAGFPLVAVINRMDKEDESSCGELRFIYRLSYNEGSSRSSLPLFLNVVFNYSKTDCAAIASSWVTAAQIGSAEAYLQGPLVKNLISLKQIELNMQIVRYPSGLKTDFGGQAIYLFRIFAQQGDAFVSIPLENMPDVAEISKSPSLKADLIKQISDPESMRKIDLGTFILKNTNGKMLANRALSLSTSGRSRMVNKPFTLIFGGSGRELLAAPLNRLEYVKTTSGLVERLNNMSCVGCHQTGGTAGFHMLGATLRYNSNFNQVILPFSPHYHAERVRREAYVKALVQKAQPHAFRPPSFYPPAKWVDANSAPEFREAKVRDLCLKSTQDFHSNLRCESGSECRSTAKNRDVSIVIGECVAINNTVPGHVCREGFISNARLNMSLGDLYGISASHDTINVSKVITPTNLGCGNPSGGVPLGRISAACDSNTSAGRLEFVDQLAPGVKPPKQMCAMRGGTQFDECAKTTNPPDCLAKAKIARGLLDTCTIGHFCREDYICQKLPVEVSRLYSGAERTRVAQRIEKLGNLGIGFCVPNYFVFNMRADGHLIPEGRK